MKIHRVFNKTRNIDLKFNILFVVACIGLGLVSHSSQAGELEFTKQIEDTEFFQDIEMGEELETEESREIADFLRASLNRIMEKGEQTREEFFTMIQHLNPTRRDELLYRFNEDLYPIASDLQDRLTVFMNNTNLDMSLEHRKITGTLILENSLISLFRARDIYARLTKQARADSAKSRSLQCAVCGKVGMIPCRCGDIFCTRHLFAPRHNCTFDYKTFEREKLREQNPPIKKPKLEKIIEL